MSAGVLARVEAKRVNWGEDLVKLAGEDATAHGFNAQGGVGCISVTANACLAGAMVFPLIVPLVMARVGIGAGVAAALVLSGLWFIAMLKTSEMPH